MIWIFKRRKSKLLHLFELQIGNSNVSNFICVQTFSSLKVQQLSVLRTYPKPKSSIKFLFIQHLLTGLLPNLLPSLVLGQKPSTVPSLMPIQKPNVVPDIVRNSTSMIVLKKNMLLFFLDFLMYFHYLLKEHADVLLGLLDTLPLPAHYKTKHLLENLVDLPAADLPDYVPDCICHPEPVSLNAIDIQSTFMPSAGVLP